MDIQINNITQEELERALEKSVLMSRRKGESPVLIFPNGHTVFSKETLLKKALKNLIDHIIAERRAYIENYDSDQTATKTPDCHEHQHQTSRPILLPRGQHKG